MIRRIHARPLGRTALGDLLLWDGDQLFYLDVQHGDLASLTGDLGLFMSGSLTDDDFLDEVVGRALYEEALPRLGPPAPDEVCAFEPVLALGGSGEADTLARVKLREHLALLAQVVLP